MLALALAWFARVQGVEPLFSAAPAGWRHEQLEFPLSFAPELEYHGVEDLLFAPGMFVPESDSYFSYVLALRLEGDVAVDEALLTRFLETYYRGLCRAVAEERKLERDASTIRAEVRREGAAFRARVELFDPFTNGNALELELELTSHSAPRATEILGLASPLARDEPIWTELHTLAKAWHEARPAPVYLNHVYAVVDPETYAALAHSSFLRETFAVTEERTTVRADLSYTGLYFYGQRTYFEFLTPQAAAGLVEGGSGLALGVEREGELDVLAKRLGGVGVQSQGGPITRQLEDESVPWFQILGVEPPPSKLNLFVMEYEPRFLTRWHAELEPAQGGVTRSAVLERYAATLGRTALRASAPFADVSRVTLSLSAPERERLLAVCTAAGHEIEAEKDEWTVFGPQFRLSIRQSTESVGLTGLELALRQPSAHDPLQLGRVSLSFQGGTARLVLRP